MFYYYFDQHPEYPPGSPREGQGTERGADVPCVFEHLAPNRQAAEGDQELSEAIATYWTNFTERGDVPNWPAFSDAHPTVMVLKWPPHTGPVPSGEGLQGLDAYFAWRRTPEGRRVRAAEVSGKHCGAAGRQGTRPNEVSSFLPRLKPPEMG